MYNATEQFAELNQTNVAQAAKLAALAVQNVDKLAKINLDTAKSALAQGVENAQAVAAVKDVQQLATLNAALVEANVQGVVDYSKLLYQLATEARAQYTALIEESWAGYTKGASRLGRQGQQVGAGRFGSRCQRVQAGRCRVDRCVRPDQPGLQAGREPGRCQRARRCCQRDEVCRDEQGPQGGLNQAGCGDVTVRHVALLVGLRGVCA